MAKTGKRAIAFLLSVLLVVSALVCLPAAADAGSSADYLDADGSLATAENVTALTDAAPALTAGWYLVSGDVSIAERIRCSGDVSLILADGATLTAPKGITVSRNNSLTVYGQSAGSGALKIDQAADYCAGIGGESNGSSGNITVNGGVLTVTGGYYGAGIGGGDYGSGAVTVNRGKLVIYGGDYAAGIGGGRFGEGTVTVNGGNVWACGGVYSAAIGGGYYGAGTVVLNGGRVTARRYSSGTGIGGGASYSGSATVAINCKDVSNQIWADSFNGTVTLAVPFTNGTQTIAAGTVGDHSKIENVYISPANASVSYCDADGTIKEKANGEYTVLSAGMTTLNAGWYALTGDLSFSDRISCSGDVCLILCDGCTLTSAKGIQVPESGSLTIYGQRPGSGALTVEGAELYNAGIGGNARNNSGPITINSGRVTVSGGEDAAAIGGGYLANGTVTVNGGIVAANGDAAGLGAGFAGRGYININGGSVTATAGGSSAAIGGGFVYSDNTDPVSTVTITGGVVNALGGHMAAGIGGGRQEGGIVTITGGTVTANSDGEYGIGGGYNGTGIVTITGGTVRAGGIIGGRYDSQVSLTWTALTDSIQAGSYNGTVTIERTFFDGTDGVFPGVVSENLKLKGKLLTPLEADCRIDWKNDSGALLETDYVKIGQTAAYDGATPLKADGPWSTYTFDGWMDETNVYSPDLQVTADGSHKAYTATYRINPNVFVQSGITHGNVTPAQSTGVPGEQISFTATPDSGYRLKSVSARRRAFLTALSGTEYDSSDSYPQLVDGPRGGRWETNPKKGAAYIVMKTNRPVEMTGYSLTTSQNAPAYNGQCNWKNWKIYGANFTRDSQATRDSSQWQLITEVVDDQVLGAESKKQYDFALGMTAPAYEYYKIEVTAGKGANLLFMYEFALIEDEKEVAVELNGNTGTFTMPEDCVYLSAEFEPLAITVAAHSLSLNGDIGVNFYAEIPNVTEDSYAEFTVDGETVTVPINLEKYIMSGDTKLYKFTCNVAAAQIDTEITGRIVNGEMESDPISYSVHAYLTEAMTKPETAGNANFMALASSLATYGWYANELFAYDADFVKHALFNDAPMTAVTADSLADAAAQIENTEAGVAYYGSSLMLRTTTAIRHYFTVPAGKAVDDFTFTCGGETLTPNVSGSYYYVEISDIASAELGTPYTVTVTDAGGSTVNAWTYSAMSYAYKALTKENADAALIDAAKALAVYYGAAKQYFGA